MFYCNFGCFSFSFRGRALVPGPCLLFTFLEHITGPWLGKITNAATIDMKKSKTNRPNSCELSAKLVCVLSGKIHLSSLLINQ